jgi:uncharacterized repeat protein (TIGR01451 family)
MGGLPIVASPMPGAKSLEGPQVPMLELQKLAPEEVKVGKPARFEIKVKNIGRVAAQHIVVIDQIPRGTKFLEAAPPCVRGVDGVLRWQVGALGPGQETTIVLQLLPEQEGEIGSVAQVIFHSQAAVRTVSTQPRVSIEHQVAERVLIAGPPPIWCSRPLCPNRSDIRLAPNSNTRSASSVPTRRGVSNYRCEPNDRGRPPASSSLAKNRKPWRKIA